MLTFNLALKNLMGAGTRTWLNVFVTALSFILIILMTGMYQGMDAHAKQVTIESEIAGGAYWHPLYDPTDPFTLEDAHAVPPPQFVELVAAGQAVPVLVAQAAIYPNGRIMPVVMKTMTSQKQRDLLSEVYLHHGMAGVNDLREKLGSSERLEMEASTLGRVVLAGESEFRIPPAYYSAASLEEAEVLTRKGKRGHVADTEFQERLELFLQELSASRRIF